MRLLAALLALLLAGAGAARHTNNWAVLVCTSRFWFNYRHVANVLSIYRTVKRLGIPDSQIVLMLADDMACNARNAHPGRVFNHRHHELDLYGEQIEVDYRGDEVSVESFMRLLTGRHEDSFPNTKRLLTDESSNVLVYMSGHGGDEFLKFQDAAEINSYDIGHVLQEMHLKGRYRELLLMVDTCQAGSLADRIYSPNVLAVGSSRVGENSYAHHIDPDVGVAVIDRFTSATLDFFERTGANASLAELFASYRPQSLRSTPAIRADLFGRRLEDVPVTDFFGSVQQVESFVGPVWGAGGGGVGGGAGEAGPLVAAPELRESSLALSLAVPAAASGAGFNAGMAAAAAWGGVSLLTVAYLWGAH